MELRENVPSITDATANFVHASSKAIALHCIPRGGQWYKIDIKVADQLEPLTCLAIDQTSLSAAILHKQ